MKLLSWNVNGLRAIHRKGNWDELLSISADIFCLQETKSTPEQLTEEVRQPEGYHAYFNTPLQKKGYSGVAIYSKIKPKKVEYAMGFKESKELDNEGRFIAAFYDDFVLLNVYFPNGGGGPARLQYKLDFYDAFLKYTQNLRKKGHSIVFCGDVNTAHEAIDLARPKANEKNTGFLPIERAWMDEVVSAGYIDTYRHFNPNKAESYTYWDTITKARDRNVGWRIDYFFISFDLLKKVKKVDILKDFYGSDHCPITLELL